MLALIYIYLSYHLKDRGNTYSRLQDLSYQSFVSFRNRYHYVEFVEYRLIISSKFFGKSKLDPIYSKCYG